MIRNFLRFISEIFTSGDRIHLEYYIDDNGFPQVKQAKQVKEIIKDE